MPVVVGLVWDLLPRLAQKHLAIDVEVRFGGFELWSAGSNGPNDPGRWLDWKSASCRCVPPRISPAPSMSRASLRRTTTHNDTGSFNRCTSIQHMLHCHETNGGPLSFWKPPSYASTNQAAGIATCTMEPNVATSMRPLFCDDAGEIIVISRRGGHTVASLLMIPRRMCSMGLQRFKACLHARECVVQS